MDNKEELTTLLKNFTQEDEKMVDGMITDLDCTRSLIRYVRACDNDVTGSASDEIVQKIINYICA